MKKLLFLFALAILLASNQPLIADDDSGNSDDMDKRREEKANEIITEMHDSGASKSDIDAQKRVNKQAFGHEGESEY